MANSAEFDVIVAGAGPVGLANALLLEDAGLSVALAGPKPAADRRTTALMMPAVKLLQRVGVDIAGLETAAPLRTMRIIDGTRRLLRAAPATFSASEIDEDAFGWNVANAGLVAELEQAVAARPAIRRIEMPVAGWQLDEEAAVATFEDGTTVSARLVAAADGRNSPAREAAGISTYPLPLSQTALVLNFAHRRPHGDISTEFHTESGPCTQVPLPGNRSSLVWVNRPERAEELMALNDEALSRAVEERIGSLLGRVEVEPGRQLYPLSAAVPRRFADRRVMLVGEAAHIFPPIGAQGMNLGLRDAADLRDVAAAHAADPGGPSAMSAYNAKRRFDIAARAGAVNMLNASLLSSFLPVQLARTLGLAAISQSAPLRGLFMREGMQPGSGLSALFGSFKGRDRASADRS